jgi:hypothetical protein
MPIKRNDFAYHGLRGDIPVRRIALDQIGDGFRDDGAVKLPAEGSGHSTLAGFSPFGILAVVGGDGYFDGTLGVNQAPHVGVVFLNDS